MASKLPHRCRLGISWGRNPECDSYVRGDVPETNAFRHGRKQRALDCPTRVSDISKLTFPAFAGALSFTARPPPSAWCGGCWCCERAHVRVVCQTSWTAVSATRAWTAIDFLRAQFADSRLRLSSFGASARVTVCSLTCIVNCSGSCALGGFRAGGVVRRDGVCALGRWTGISSRVFNAGVGFFFLPVASTLTSTCYLPTTQLTMLPALQKDRPVWWYRVVLVSGAILQRCPLNMRRSFGKRCS